VRFDSQPSSAAGAIGVEQLPHPLAHVEVHSPLEQARVAVCEVEHPRAHPPQSVVLVDVFVSQPPDGFVVQCAKPVLQSRLQSALHVPSIGLQHVVPLQTTDPWFCG
jgi:hypothetical protein